MKDTIEYLKNKNALSNSHNFFQLHFMQFFSADATIFLKRFFHFLFDPQNIKNSPIKLVIIPLDTVVHEGTKGQIRSL